MTDRTHPKPTRSTTASIRQLRALFDGRAISPDNPAYDGARRVLYGDIDRRPAAIVRARDATDVSRVVGLAREGGLELAVRSGGHSPAGHGTTDGGIVLDLSGMKNLEIDAKGRTAWAETGLTAGEYTALVGVHDLATGFGDTGSVGIGGITLSGGIGYLVRKHGLTIDDLLAADVVTADGKLRRVDAGTHPDLFWAIRGGGGNFGVATRLKFRLHDVGTVVGGMLMLPATPETISSFAAGTEAAPEGLSTIANVMPAPPMPSVPAEYHGRLIIRAMLVYAGGVEAGERVVAPFRALARPLADTVGPMRYPEMFRDSEAPMRVSQIRVLGGAMARVPAEATAFAHRKARLMVNVAAYYERPDEVAAREAWAKDFARALRRGDGGASAGFLSDEGEARVREAYPGATWEQLAEIKDRYDPTNLFRLNQNIPPATKYEGRVA